ncbi:9532_t:CDS:2 [Funneliformis mosseae]|uniref:9532_t:CDS:1 n=1 Tax=Funneliformis mosseae TaxID=27381 RepID=A0A9N9CW76_FUNMO|nr:9532_t:CDS:2 [Funneliformis mosseae]
MVDIKFIENYIEKKGKYIYQYFSDERIVCENRNMRSEANYHQKTLAKMLQNRQTLKTLGQALNRMKIPDFINFKYVIALREEVNRLRDKNTRLKNAISYQENEKQNKIVSSSKMPYSNAKRFIIDYVSL